MKHKLLVWLSGRVAAPLFKLLFATCRIEFLTPKIFDEFFNGDESCIGVTWHRGAIYSLYYFGPRNPAIMISRSKDGSYLASYLEAMGGIPIRGSSNAGGTVALKAMADHLSSGPRKFAATVADGPRGPRFKAKMGMVKLASQTGCPLMPAMWSADRCWVFKNSWDQTMIPKPFAKIKAAAGEMRRYPCDMNAEQLKQATLELEKELNRLKDQVDEAAGFTPPA